MRGSMSPMLRAVSAEAIAICASSLLSGLGVTAQSAKMKKPFSPYSLSGEKMRNAPLTTLSPGRVLMSCSAGRSTLPVVLCAPATSPSASPDLIMRQAR